MKNITVKHINKIICIILSLVFCISLVSCEQPSENSIALNDFIALPAGSTGNFSEYMLVVPPKSEFKLKTTENGQVFELITTVKGHSEVYYLSAVLNVSYTCEVVYSDHSSEILTGSNSILLDFAGSGKYSNTIYASKEIVNVFSHEITYSYSGTVKRDN